MSHNRRPSPFAVRKPDYRVQAHGDEAELHILDEIGFRGVQAKDVVNDLKGITASTIHVRLNTPGGNVFDGVTIYNALRAHPARIVTHVDALAASIGSIIALAGDEVRIARNAFFMIHEPWTVTIGDSAQLRKDAGTLDKIGDMLRATYVAKTGAKRDQVDAWMSAETWFSAEEAEAHGFADAIDDFADEKAAASFDLSIYARVPRELVASADDAPNTVRDLERILRDAGYSRSDAKAVAASGFAGLTQRDVATDRPHDSLSQLLATLQS